jgi:hypothetical protein
MKEKIKKILYWIAVFVGIGTIGVLIYGIIISLIIGK